MSQFFYYESAGAEHIKKERNKAKTLKKSQWWQQKLQEGVCFYCEESFARDNLTMDHKVPVARGGVSSKSNIVVCCKECNSQKQAKTSAELALDKL